MDDIDQLGTFTGGDADGADDSRREGRRTMLALAAAAGLGTLAVVVAIWMISVAGAAPGSNQAGGPAADAISGALATDTGDGETPATETTSGDATPTSASTLVAPSPTSAPVQKPTLDLPPPEQPTFTAVATATPSTTGPAATQVPPAPSTTAPRSGPAVVTDVVLTCRRAGDQTRASLSFRTSAPVAVWLSGGGKIATGAEGPGQVTVKVSGGRAGYCLATVDRNSYGPVPAS